MPLQTRSFGPFIRGVADGRNTSLDSLGFLRYARHAVYVGGGRLTVGVGSAVAITLMDDQGTPVECTSVPEVIQFGNGVLAVGHSTATSRAYLYRLDKDLTGWYNLAGTFTASATATPLATVLWTTMPDRPVVHIAEMLGQATITCTNASDGVTQSFATRIFTGSAINNYTADIDGAGGSETVYALGCFAFQAHSWLWGFGSGAVVATNYRPELLRFGGPNGGTHDLATDGSGSFSVGHRVRSAREAVVGVCVAGAVAYVGTAYSLWPVVGAGRDSWDKSRPLDDSYGFIGPKAACAANGVCYYWSPRGPARVAGLNRPEPLWDAIPEAVAAVVDPEKIVAAFNATTDQVEWFLRGTGVTGNQLVAAYDTRRNLFVGPSRDVGVLVGCANFITPVNAPNLAAAAAPSGPPTTAVTSGIYAFSATASWTNGDTTTGVTTEVEVRQQGTTPYTLVATLPAGTSTTVVPVASSGVAYEWRASHLKNGQRSGYLGPVAGSQFTTTTTLAPPTGVALVDVGPALTEQGRVTWLNSGESGVYTEIYLDNVYQGRVDPGTGNSTYYVTIYATLSYAVKVRHTKSGVTPSAYNGPVSATLTYGDSP